MHGREGVLLMAWSSAESKNQFWFQLFAAAAFPRLTECTQLYY